MYRTYKYNLSTNSKYKNKNYIYSEKIKVKNQVRIIYLHVK